MLENKLDFHLSENLKYGLFALLAFVFSVLMYLFVISPLATERADMALKNSTVATQLAELQTFATQNQDYDALTKIQMAKIEDAKKKLPDVINVSSLINEYSKLAEANSVVLNSLRPEAMVKEGNANALPIELNLTGDYFHMVNFLQEIERGERFISLRSAKFTTNNSGSLTLVAQFNVYSLKGADMNVAGGRTKETGAGKTDPAEVAKAKAVVKSAVNVIPK